MGRPKGSKNKEAEAQGVEATKEKAVETVKTEEKVIKTETASIKNEKVEIKQELARGGAFLAIVDGHEVMWSRIALDVAFKRGTHEIKIPKGSPYIPPKDSKCENCG